MRDYLVLFLVVATIPLAFYQPFFGLLGFSWLAYMRPQDLSWGLAAELPLSKYVTVALWLSLMMRGKINIFRRTLVTGALLLLWIWLLVTCFTAVHQEVAFAKFEDISKVFLIALITVVLVTSAARFRIIMGVIGLSLGFLGLKYGAYGVLRGGVQFTRGVGGMIADNNDFALALNMTLPILVYLTWDLRRRWLRLACMGLVPLSAITVIFTHSRGGFLSLAAVTLYLIWNSRRRVAALVLVAVLALGATAFVPHSFYERISSIGNYQEDGSSLGRLNAWQASIRMANDYPVFGVGLDNFLYEFIYYAPNPDDIHVAHNTWFQVLAETGYTGLCLYLLLFAATWWTLWRVRRRARRYGVRWAENGAKCLGASVLAFMVGGTFLNRAHFDLIYHVMALCACLDRILTHELTVQATDEDAAPGVETTEEAAA
jgi:probable O-glycosylation ligase (exosortase A-associated)